MAISSSNFLRSATRPRFNLVLHPTPGSFTAEGDAARWSNKDLDPVPASRKKWEWYHVGGFWLAEGFSAAQMQVASGAVALGLNPGLALVACLVGNLLVVGPLCISGYMGAKYSINFPIIARASFGMWGAYFAMIIRAIVCVIWYGVQASLGGNAVQCMVEAIWPSFKTWHLTSFPSTASITAPQLLCFALFWLASLPFLFLTVPALRWLFLIKSGLMPLFYVALFTWALTAAGGVGPLFSIPTNIIGGWSVGYVFCATIVSAISGNATFAVNMADITRYAHSPRQITLAQAIAMPTVITLVELLGAIMAASAQVVYGQVLWNPLTIVLLFENRSAKFFAGLLFAFANIATNVGGNSIPFANDVSGMFPKYMNILRGQLLCAVLGFAINPWAIQAKATRFLAFLNGYSVFLGPLLGVILSDFLFVRRAFFLFKSHRKIRPYNIQQLYTPHGLYWYHSGVNWRAMVAMMVGIVPLLPGLVHAINPSMNVSRGALNFYTLSWLDGLVLSGLSYYLLYLIKPFKAHAGADAEDRGVESVEVIEGRGTPSDSRSVDGSGRSGGFSEDEGGKKDAGARDVAPVTLRQKELA